MKKIINGKLYNTETAKEVATYSNGYPGSDFRVIDETLYQKRTGEYFLHGEGGPMTRYAKEVWGGVGYGEEIIPVTEARAKEWILEHCSADTYMELFGEVEE